MSILLTGATGFIGSYVLKSFLSHTNETIIILKRSFSDISRISMELLKKNVVSYDIDCIDLERIFLENKIECIIHIATEYGRKENTEHIVLNANLVFPITLLKLAIKYEVKSFINTDSYFNKKNFSYNFLIDYSLSKKSFLLWLKHYANKIKIFNLILEHPFGAFDNIKKFTEFVIRKVAIYKEHHIDLTLGAQKRDFIYVKDIATAYVAVFEYSRISKKEFLSIEVGSGRAITIRTFVEAVKKLSFSPTILNFGALPYRDDEIMCSVADNTFLKKIGWEKKYTIEAALKEIFNEYSVR